MFFFAQPPITDVKNVKDPPFNAKGDNVTDDWAAIQAAVDWTNGPNRGSIYFPVGKYVVSQPITFNYDGNLAIRFYGEGSASIVQGSFSGYVFDRSLGTPNNTTGGRIFEKLAVTNGSSNAASGCIRVGSSNGVYIRDCVVRGQTGITTEDSVGNSSQNINLQNVLFTGPQQAGCNGLIIGGSGVMMGCRGTNWDVAYRVYGKGFNASGFRAEENNTMFLLGLDSGGNAVGASGFSIAGGTSEGNWTSADFAGPCTGFTISSFSGLGHDSPNAGMIPGIQPSQYGIRVRANNAMAGVITGCSHGQWADVAAIAVEAASSRADLLVENCSFSKGSGAGANWLLPTNAYTARFLRNNIQPIWTFSQLPTGGNVFEGEEFDISDSTKGAGQWGQTVAGGGANRGLVRWNGSVYTLVSV